MKITFDIDISDLKTMSDGGDTGRENLWMFLNDRLLGAPLMDLMEAVTKKESDYPNPAYIEPTLNICKDNVEVGNRLMKSLKIDE